MMFNPFAAKSQGYSVYPLVEIDLQDIFDALSKEFGIQIGYLHLAKIECDYVKNIECYPFYDESVFPIIDKSIFMKEIEIGVYLEALYVSNAAIIIVLGGDEVWVVLDRAQYQQRPSKFSRLISISNENIKILGKEKNFDIFR